MAEAKKRKYQRVIMSDIIINCFVYVILWAGMLGVILEEGLSVIRKSDVPGLVAVILLTAFYVIVLIMYRKRKKIWLIFRLIYGGVMTVFALILLGNSLIHLVEGLQEIAVNGAEAWMLYSVVTMFIPMLKLLGDISYVLVAFIMLLVSILYGVFYIKHGQEIRLLYEQER